MSLLKFLSAKKRKLLEPVIFCKKKKIKICDQDLLDLIYLHILFANNVYNV